MLARIVNVITHRPDLVGTGAAPLPPLDAAQLLELAAARSAPAPASFPRNGPALWAELHQRALKHRRGRDDYPWLVQFETRLPCGYCRADWQRMLRLTPPDYRNYFAWTVDRHNEVNSRLGKPVVSHREARDRWQSPTARKARKNA